MLVVVDALKAVLHKQLDSYQQIMIIMVLAQPKYQHNVSHHILIIQKQNSIIIRHVQLVQTERDYSGIYQVQIIIINV